MSIDIRERPGSEPQFSFTATYRLFLTAAVALFQKALECNLQAELHAEGSTRARVEVRLDDTQWDGLLEALSAVHELHEFGVHQQNGREQARGDRVVRPLG